MIVDLIGATTTKTGLSVRCELDPHRYPKGVVVSDAEIAALNIERDGSMASGTIPSRPAKPHPDQLKIMHLFPDRPLESHAGDR